MQLLRIDTANYGVIYVRPEDIRVLGRMSDTQTNIGVMVEDVGRDLHVDGDIDEVALMLETNIPDCKIVRLG